MDLKHLFENFNQYFTLYFIFPGIIGLGCFLTWKLRFVQITHLKQGFSFLREKKMEGKGNISRFKALSAVLAGNFGTGNISGMAIAIAMGGPGSLVWMWVMAFFGSVIQYASCTLGVAFRKKTENGEYVGGPMYYLRDGLGQKKLAAIFAICTLFGAITVGNFAQTNSVLLPLKQMGINPLYCSIVIAGLLAFVILGGIKRLAGCASIIVPVKAALYFITALVIIIMHHDQVVPAFKLMFRCAFGFSQVAGGVIGFGVLKALTIGFDRGLFATDAGTGVVPIVQASTRSQHPAMEGIASLIAPFIVMIVCTATGLVLLVTGAWTESGLQSTNMVTFAFSKGLGNQIGAYIVIISLFLFGYTSMFSWAYCGEKAFEFLVGTKKGKWFRYLYIALVPIGSILHVNMIWVMADISITMMLFINLIGIGGLSSYVIKSHQDFQRLSRVES
jgi:alanine or glycine:cation symporter, AGCS family